MTPSYLMPAIVAAVIAWRVYVRVRRNIGRQPLRPRRLVAGIVIFGAVTILLAAFSLLHPKLLIGLGIGLALGASAALAGLRLTQFETVAEGKFYTPNPYIGVALSMLVVVRVAYRFVVLSSVSNNPAQPPALMQSALSFCVFGLLAGYYIAYYTGVLRRSRVPPP